MSDDVVSLRAETARAVELALERVAPPGAPLVAACSGGADSRALVWALAGLAQRWPLASVAFVDHGLRDVSAEREAARAAARAAGVPFVERRVTLTGGNLQASARRARYAALIAVAREVHEDALVATGHTLSDQAETVLARLLRGSGLPGLAGLAPRRGRLVRPLLDLSRRVTRALGLEFVDDPSNVTPRFQRNRLRVLLERLGEEQPAIERALATLAEAARASTRLLDALALAAPETRFGGHDLETTQTLLLHLTRVHGARGPERRAMRAWAQALTAGGLDAVSLGEGLRGIARGGRATLVPDEDPRRAVVAWRPGTYRGSAMELQVSEVSQSAWSASPEGETFAGLPEGETFAGLPEGEAFARASDVGWPLKLRPARRDEAGVFGDEVDLATGAPLGGWRVDDASGRTLVPAPAEQTASANDARSFEETRWIRIVLKPFERARDTRVVGNSKGPLNRE